MGERGRPRHPDILTPREWEVLALVRDGRTNAEIGEQLGITERTAKFHVSEILGKLDLSSREEIAAWPGHEQPSRWRGALIAVGAAGTLAAVVAALSVLIIGVVQTERASTSGLDLQPGDVLHYTMSVTQTDSEITPGNHETWMLIGEGFNEEKTRVYAYNDDGRITQDGWHDAESGVSSNNGREFTRPHFRSIFKWEDGETIGEDLLRSSKLPNVAPSPDEEPYLFSGYDEVASVRVRIYEREVPQEYNAELPLPGDGWLIRRTFLSDDPFGLWFGWEAFYIDEAGVRYPVGEWQMTSFEVVSEREVPPGTFDFDAPSRVGTQR